MKDLNKYLKTIDAETFEEDAQSFKDLIINQGKIKINGDGFVLNYYKEDDKLCLVRFNGEGNLTHSFLKDNIISNKYFKNKNINIERYNLQLENNNFKINIINKNMGKIAEQRIYFDYINKEFKKVFDGSFKDGFYYYKNNKRDFTDNVIFSEGVADAMLFLQNLEESGINTDTFAIVCSLTDNNMINVFNQFKEVADLRDSKKIYYLIDNDENNLGLNTYLKIKELNNSYDILPVLSYKNGIKDFCDIYNNDKVMLNEVNDNVKKFLNNQAFILNICYNNIIEDFDNKSIFINNTIIKSIIKSFEVYNNFNIDTYKDKDYINLLRRLSNNVSYYDYDYEEIIKKVKQYFN